MSIKKIINSYTKEVQEKKQNEVHCFQSLSKAISVNTTCYSKEFHGTKFLVKFKSKRPNPHRSCAHCELCDVLYIVFSKNDVRISFIQAKREYSPLKANPCLKFTANLEQWELLHWQRSVKSSSKNIFIPRNILKSSYRSITSFLFFHPVGNIHELVYCSASSLFQADTKYKYKSANGKVNLNQHSPSHHLQEILYSENMNDFLEHLLNGKIGASLKTQNGTLASYVISLVNFLIDHSHDEDLNVDLLYELKHELMKKYHFSQEDLSNGKPPFLPKCLNIIKQPEEDERLTYSSSNTTDMYRKRSKIS